MKIRIFQRDLPKRATLVVLALAAVAGVVTGREKPAVEVVAPHAQRAASSARPGPQTDIDLDKLVRTEGAMPRANPFAPLGFDAAQAPGARAAAPAAPPLPFQYIGKVIENGKLEVYVLHEGELLALAPGQKIGGQYRVDKVSGARVTFTYLPLRMKQTLDLPSVNG